MSGYKIDEIQPSIWEQLGKEKFVELSTAFYTRVYEDKEHPFFRAQFDGRPKAAAIQNQYEFFIQRMGKQERREEDGVLSCCIL